MASAVIAAALVFCLSNAPAHAVLQPEEIAPSGGRGVPDIRFKTPEGLEMSLGDQEGRLTLLHFWATWCAPCVDELPKLDAMYEEYRGQGVQVVPISLDLAASGVVIEAFYKDNNIKALPVYLGDYSQFVKTLDLSGMPTTIFIKEGKEIGRANGPVRWNDAGVRAWLDAQLKMDASVF